MRKLAVAALVTIASLAVPAAVRAQGSPAPAAPSVTATHVTPVELGFFVFEVRDVNWKEQSFVADSYMWVRYTEADDEKSKEIENFDIMNSVSFTKEEDDRTRVGDERYVCWRVIGTFFMHADFRRYPFDEQRIGFIIEPHSLTETDLVFRDDVASYRRTGIPQALWGSRPEVEIPEFRVSGTERREQRVLYDTDFGNPKNGTERYSRFTLSILLARDFRPYFFKIVMPLIVIIAMAYLALLLPPSEVATASGLGITATLTCMAFNVTVAQNLPEVGYLVTSDKFFLATYCLLFLNLLQSILVYRWHTAGRAELATRWLRTCSRVFPFLFFGAFGVLLVDALTK